MLAMHWAAPNIYHMHAQHCMTPYSTHSTQPGVLCFACWLTPSSHSPSLPNHTRLFACILLGFILDMLLLMQFCSRFLFLTLSFLVAGSLSTSSVVHVCLLFLILRSSGFSAFSRISRSGWFSGFSPFLRIFRSGWFLFCLPAHYLRFGGQPIAPMNLCPTSDILNHAPHPTAHLPPTHTLPPHNCTLPSFTQDLIPDPRWTWVAHYTHGPQTRRRRTSTHSGATGRGVKDSPHALG